MRLPGGDAYRDFSLMLFDNDAVIGANTMPYPTAVDGPALVNYRSEPRPADDATAFSSAAHGDPVTPILQAHVGDPVRVHVLGAPGSEQPHVISLGGLRWSADPYLPGANTVEAAAVVAVDDDGHPRSSAAPAARAAWSATCGTATCAVPSPRPACGA